jgi:long-chain fatty acid transport protein
MKKSFLFLFSLGFSILIMSPSIYAGGIETSGVGVKALGMGGAFIALANDTTAVFYNPAGLAQLQQGINVDTAFTYTSPKLNYTLPNGEEQKAVEEEYPLFFGLSSGITHPLVFGFGMYSQYARTTDWFSDAANNFGPLKSEIVRVDYVPTIAYEITSQLSLGAGFVISQTEEKWENPVPVVFNPLGMPIAFAQYSDEADGIGYGGNVGILYKITPELNIGAVWRSEINTKLEGKAEVEGVGEDDYSLNWDFPQSAGVGIAYKPLESLTIALDLNWTNWSDWKEVSYDYEDDLPFLPDTAHRIDAQDSIKVSIGTEFKPHEQVALRAGYRFDDNAIPDDTVQPQCPDLRNHAFSIGGGYEWKPFRCDIFYEYLFSSKKEVTTSDVGYDGKYQVEMHTVGFMVSFSYF